ncbi:Mu transposase C-terminal domain-containing protein [Microbacterium sp. LEMMJ01]|uniref:Mu transposase C-terminal domain-containing protein n=1 Tax=Microbacterium sp. LEMMJ01 TaxID=1978350 RepID=UPI0015533C7F|nr:Mu transposase C-terminal domain-containing protein [Microbacterium sp. LEMMJ01]
MSKTVRLEPGCLIQVEAEIWVLESVRNGKDARLRLQGSDDDWIVMSMRELLRHAGTARRTAEVRARPEGKQWPADVLDMESHLLEVFRGIPMDPFAPGPRPLFNPTTTTQESRIVAKIAELAGTSAKMSRKSFFNYWTTYQTDGIAGLNNRMHRKGRKRLVVENADPRLISAIDEILRGRVDMPTWTRRQCAFHVRRLLDQRHPGDPVCGVKPTTLQGLINERDAGMYTFDKASTRRNSANSPDREYKSGSASRLGETCEIDSTTLDVQVWDDKGEPFRPKLTVLFDVASRVPMAWAIHADSPKGFDHAILLARAIVGRKAVPGSASSRLSASSVLPVALMKTVNRFLDDDSLAVPWIFPESITIDGGADFRSKTFRDALLRYGITPVLAPPGAGTNKPHVERNFGTIASDFATWLPGATGNSVANKGRRDQPTLTLDSVRVAFDTWVTTVYLNKPHSGLKHGDIPGKKWTPNQMYSILFSFGPGVQLPFGPEDYFALLPTERRIIGRAGINFRNRRFDSSRLDELRNRSLTGAAPGSKQARKFEISFDPYNLSCVWVRHPTSGEWIECWDTALEEKTAWMAAEAAVKLVETFGSGKSTDKVRQTEFVDAIERFDRKDSRLRSRRLRASAAAQRELEDPPLPSEPTPLEMSPASSPADIASIDWQSAEYDIVAVKEIRP